MKKVIRILLIFSILCISSCDFLRKVAGRPTEADLQAKAERIELRRQEVRDSISAALEALRAKQIQDSLEAVAAARSLDSLGVKLSSVFRFGEPQEKLGYRYNLIIGVFRNRFIADSKYQIASNRGFSPFLIPFNGGINALCLCSSDSLGDVLDVYITGRKANVCPSDAWVYVKE